jgi:hypothetical protein
MSGCETASIADRITIAGRYANRHVFADTNGADSNSIAELAVSRQHSEISGAA